MILKIPEATVIFKRVRTPARFCFPIRKLSESELMLSHLVYQSEKAQVRPMSWRSVAGERISPSFYCAGRCGASYHRLILLILQSKRNTWLQIITI